VTRKPIAYYFRAHTTKNIKLQERYRGTKRNSTQMFLVKATREKVVENIKVTSKECQDTLTWTSEKMLTPVGQEE
jgi:hypothetical protein